MGESQSVPELVAAAQAKAKAYEDRIAEIQKRMRNETVPDAQVADLRVATEALEFAAVDLFSLFEGRMQHHFKRGPFSRKLRSLLLESKQGDLADRVHQYYLTINVLKHGKGASYRELLNTPNALFVVKPIEDIATDELHAHGGLIDVSVPGFFDGLAATILEAHHFLENR